MDLLNSETVKELFDTVDVSNELKLNKKPHTNLYIDKLYIKGNEKENYILKPNEVVFAVSKEFSLKKDQIGLLFAKNDYDRKGLLLFGSKIVHPSYEGRVTAQILNISTDEISVRKNDCFFELLIFKINCEIDPYDWSSKKKNYLDNVKKDSFDLPKLFLNIDEKIDKVVKKTLEEQGWSFIKNFSIISTIVFGIFAAYNMYLSNKAVEYIDNYSKIENVDDFERLKYELQTLKNKVNEIQNIPTSNIKP